MRVRYDSEYAASMVQGKWKAKANLEVIREGREALASARAAGLAVEFRHVKGHSGHKWNDRADELADEGAQSGPGGTDRSTKEWEQDGEDALRVIRTAGHGTRGVLQHCAKVRRPRSQPMATSQPPLT